MGNMLTISSGKKYNKLTILSELPRRRGSSGRSHRRVLCLCDCGKTLEVDFLSVRYGAGKSCGCLKGKGNYKHGKSKTHVYEVWSGMIKRCNNPNDPEYKNYGGRSIKVCDQWRDSFKNFFDDMGEPPPKMTLERKDVNGNYCLGNCKWATRKEQARNRRTNVCVVFNGKKLCLADWAEELGLPEKALQTRVRRGWTIERALTQPIRETTGLRFVTFK